MMKKKLLMHHLIL